MHDDEVTFNVFEAIKYPMGNGDCFHIDIVDKLTIERFKEEHPTLPLESCIIQSNTNTKKNHARRECVNYLEAMTVYSKKKDFMEFKHLPSTLVFPYKS